MQRINLRGQRHGRGAGCFAGKKVYCSFKRRRTPEKGVRPIPSVDQDPELATPETKKYPETDLGQGIVGLDGQDNPHSSVYWLSIGAVAQNHDGRYLSLYI